MKVQIISDSTCDLSPELAEAYGIEIVPLSVTLGERTGADGSEIRPEDIYAYVDQSGELPKTSAVNAAEYERVFRRHRKEGRSVVHFCISSEFSSCYLNALEAARSLGEIYVVDSRNLSCGQGLLVLRAAELAREGKSAREIYEECFRLIPKAEASFVIDRLDYLRKGGRCDAISAFGANMLHLKPCIDVLDGKMIPGKKYRGKLRKVLTEYTADRLENRDDVDLRRVFLAYTRCDPEEIRAVREKLEQYGFEEILETVAGSTVTCHCGPGALGVMFLRK